MGRGTSRILIAVPAQVFVDTFTLKDSGNVTDNMFWNETGERT
jgi:hypothetical protein